MPKPQRSAVRSARTPFYFKSAEHLLRIEPEKASTLGELLDGLKSCREASIFQHTFRTLQEHHFIQEGYSNDFAHWALFACNAKELAERLSGIDVREFISVKALRARFIEIMEAYLDDLPAVRERAATRPFYFCASDAVVVPTTYVARNLTDFAQAVEKITVHSIHYHFIEARLRLNLDTNDFSVWLQDEMGLPHAADLLNHIDIYTLTLQGVRNRILRIVETAIA